MKPTLSHNLSRRERHIMDILYRRGRATAAEVQAELENPPGYSAVRATLRVLEEKGHARHEEQDLRYVYLPTVPRGKARLTALRHMVETFFDGSVEQTVAALLDGGAARLDGPQLERLSQLVEKARKEGR